jgi:hypothetical protein
MFLEVYLFSTAWLVRIYVRGCIPKLRLVRAVTKVARNTAEGVRFTSTMKGNSVHAAEWHKELHQLIESKKKG